MEPRPRKLLDQVSDLLRVKHYSYRTEQTYIQRIRRYILFHNKTHPKDMGSAEIEAFLTHLAVHDQVAASTQNQSTTERDSLSVRSASKIQTIIKHQRWLLPMTGQLLNSEEIVTQLDISHLVIEDEIPVDNFQSAKQQRLLVEPLYASWSPGVPFIADSNIGLFYALKQDPLVPDAFLSLNLQMPADWSQKQNRSYFVWEFGKLPEVCVEIVSNRQGNELDAKKDDYARIGVAYYAVFDPLKQLQGKDELNGSLLKAWELTGKKYRECSQECSEPVWLESIGLGLTVWEGTFEEQHGLWLRWCDRQGQVIPTGTEGREVERQRAESERQRAERLAERLRAMGVNPDEI